MSNCRVNIFPLGTDPVKCNKYKWHGMPSVYISILCDFSIDDDTTSREIFFRKCSYFCEFLKIEFYHYMKIAKGVFSLKNNRVEQVNRQLTDLRLASRLINHDAHLILNTNRPTAIPHSHFRRF